MHMRWLGLLALAAIAGATLPGELSAQRRQREVIMREEILKSPQKDQDLFEAIRVLRPHFFAAPRGARSLGGTVTAPLAIYVDRMRQSGGDVLRQIMASTVEEVRYLDPARSENEFGITANGGALVIKLYRADKDTTRRPPG